MQILKSLKVLAGVALLSTPSGVFVPNLTTGRRNAARAAAFRASVNRRKPGRYARPHLSR